MLGRSCAPWPPAQVVFGVITCGAVALLVAEDSAIGLQTLRTRMNATRNSTFYQCLHHHRPHLNEPSSPSCGGGGTALLSVMEILAPARKMGRDAHCGGGWWPPYFCIPRPTPRPPSFLSDAGCQRPVRPVCFGKATTHSNHPKQPTFKPV